MRFVLDAQLPPALARALREAGYDVRDVRKLGLRDADDSEIWDYSLANQAPMIIKDQDFAECLMSRRPAPVIVWLRSATHRTGSW